MLFSESMIKCELQVVAIFDNNAISAWSVMVVVVAWSGSNSEKVFIFIVTFTCNSKRNSAKRITCVFFSCSSFENLIATFDLLSATLLSAFKTRKKNGRKRKNTIPYTKAIRKRMLSLLLCCSLFKIVGLFSVVRFFFILLNTLVYINSLHAISRYILRHNVETAFPQK